MSTIITSHSPDTSRISAAILAEDDIGSIIRCHFEAERAADHVLSVVSKGRYNAGKSSLRYLSQKLDVISLFGVHSNFIAPLSLLNKHRNDFAHKGKEAFSQADLDEMRKLVQAGTPAFSGEMEVTIEPAKIFKSKLRDLSVAQQYVIYAVTAAFILTGVVSAEPDR